MRLALAQARPLPQLLSRRAGEGSYRSDAFSPAMHRPTQKSDEPKKKGVGAGSAYTLSGISKGSRLLVLIIGAHVYYSYPAKVGATLRWG